MTDSEKQINRIQFYSCCKNGDIEKLKYLVSIGVDNHTTINIGISSASLYGHLNIVKYLVSIGADINDVDNLAIKFASINDRLDVAEYLLSVGGEFEDLTSEHKEYFKQKRAYSKWRRGYLRRWIRRVLTPLYFSPQFQGGIQAKKELESVFHE